ncbi:basic amino acid ABC transporter substrate-binding protein [Mobilicoccus pelagius]|uniref:Putative amino acid ABC transporter substrate-binding protein n=1 Tax=Mobilicoccus pelagius NBRC 104925 TaxID=1089455 RepID=H5UV87_9MICO|nr:basic amino acid ABC transporter substrate-binding protein [Mobilicoccus pelagius]GAB49645.1 putative amino acid ABC transporter substrate-binding protein [Mobilicoccus pelagius NBRC 104925]
MSRPLFSVPRTLAVTAVAALALAGCGSGDGANSGAASTDSSGYSLVKPGTLTVCTHLAYKPFEFPDASGKIVGFDVDLLDMVAKDMGLTQETVDVPFDQIWSGAALQSGRCDLGAAGMTMTPERANSVLFSEPYFDAEQALITKKGSGITNLAQMRGKKLGVQTDTTGQKYGQENAEANGYEVVVFDDLPSTVNAVKAGNVDAAVNDNGVLYDFTKENPDTEVVTEFHTGEKYGIAARKDQPSGQKLIDEVNKVLQASKADGRYKETYEKWFGTAPQSAGETADASSSPSDAPTSVTTTAG